MTETTWINGELAQFLDVADRGLQYGDGLFETIAVFDGHPQLLEFHLARLDRGVTKLKFPAIDLAQLESEIRLAATSLRKGVLKLILTRGVSARGYRPPEPTQPTRILCGGPWPAFPVSNSRQGVRARVCEQRLAIQPALAGVKHLNRLEQVLARAEWSDPDVAEGIMLDTEGRLVCGSMSNLYLVHDHGISTPSLHRCGVYGVMREQVRSACQALDLAWEETDLSLQDAVDADEVFLSNALVGLWPVRELDGRSYPDHPVCRELQEHLAGRGIRQCDLH
ncbi:MAG: aminodeoxychorismate lyase [Gammaproteobacteria bacterium]|nr:aminodeoxychorismate lyase [Gammaproteobacteria bacterium]